MPDLPLRVAIVNDYEIVVAGLAAALSPFVSRVRLVELDASMPVVSDADVVLYDSFGQVQGDRVDLGDLVRASDARVVVFSWNTESDLVDRALSTGAAGYISKQLPAEEIVQAIETVASGQIVRPDQTVRLPVEQTIVVPARWPGADQGLSVREAEVIALISQGLSNQDIAEQIYLSINSVKTYIRSGYRKIGATSRSQAVIWGLRHGFAPDRSRQVGPR